MRLLRRAATLLIFAVSVAMILASVGFAGPSPQSARWIVDLHGIQRLDGLMNAARARGCDPRHQTDRFASFDCPQGQTPAAGAQRAQRYLLHDSTANTLIRADDVHAGAPVGPYDGSGVTVAVIDTGADTDHQALASSLVGCLNTTGDANACEDLDGHGTAAASIIAGVAAGGGGAIEPDSVAPAAGLLVIKVFPDDGSPVFSDDVAVAVLAAVSFGADVISLSLGGGRSSAADCDGAGDPAVDAINVEAAGAGVTVVASAGNEGFTNGISFPACASHAIAVGAVYQRNQGSVQWQSGCTDARTSTDKVTCFSNSGSGLDVVAPGAFVLAALRGGGFSYFHGTSASAPVVAGAAALLQQQSPGLAGGDIREALDATALELGNAHNRRRNGNGRIDSVEAASYVDENMGLCAGVACDDGDACNGLETCDPATGTCLDAAGPSCDDGDVCTEDSCDPASGCVNADNGTCPACIQLNKGRCNCDGHCTRKEAREGVCADCP